MYVEASLINGKGEMILTGQLGEVMQESARAALSYARANIDLFAVKDQIFDNRDIHIHVPAGAIPKDGPSAGIAMATALISALTERPVNKDVAMTGEITLRGRVLPIGGLKEKLLAAVRAGISEVIVPERNRQEVLRLPPEVRDKLVIHMISHVQDAFDLVLARPLKDRIRGGITQPPGRRRRTARGARDRKGQNPG